MPTYRSPAARARAAQAAQEHRHAREAARFKVPLGDRPPDDDDIDDVAIDLALRGHRRYAVTLRRTELVEAIRIGTARGIGVPELADLLCLWEREVQRFRAEGRAARQKQAVAA